MKSDFSYKKQYDWIPNLRFSTFLRVGVKLPFVCTYNSEPMGELDKCLHYYQCHSHNCAKISKNQTLAHSVLFCVVSSLLCPIAHMARIVLSNKTENAQLFRIFLPICEVESWRKKASGRLAKTVRHETIRRVRAYQISHLISLLRLFITYTLGRHPDVQLQRKTWFWENGLWE